MTDGRLARQLGFVLEIDKLKSVLRQTFHTADNVAENDAEHSWHLAMMALLLAEHSAAPVDVARVVRMALVHDLVEIYAGDTFAYDEAGQAGAAEREGAAADRLYALLPDDQGRELRMLWDEFEAQQTAEARFALTIDRLAAIMLNAHTDGVSWREHGVTAAQVRARLEPARVAAPALWRYGLELIEQGVAAGTIKL